MKSIIKTIIILILISSVTETYSQMRYSYRDDFISTIEYSTSFNTGKAADYISTTGFAGFGFGFKKYVKENVTLGLYFGMDIQGKDLNNQLIELENGALYGRQARYLNYFSILANGSYYFTDKHKSRFVPYVQLNAGTYYIYQRLEVGIVQVNNDNWHFGGGPEAGLMAVLGSNVGITLNARYNYAFSSGSTLTGESGNDYSFVNVNIGLNYFR